MAERRSLSSAVTNPIAGMEAELVRSFVTQSPPPEKPSLVSPKPHAASESANPSLRSAVTANQPRQSTQVAMRKSRTVPVGLIPVTVRLRPEIAGALKRASLERELDGEQVFTQQNLVENVLEPWLKEHGFLD